MKKKFLSKLLTMLLVASMVFTLLPVSTMAAYGGWDNWGFDWSDLWNWGENDTTDDAQTTDDELEVYDADLNTQTSENPFRIVMLDCGRKHFSVKSIEDLINTMHQYGYNQLQLAFGNGGLRFVLNDMALTVGNTTLASDTVKTNIKNGNKNFNGDESVLTQDDMDTIISYANSKGIAIVPMLNMPGHMNWLNPSFSTYASGDGLNITNTEACSFAYALLQKYVDYFNGEGCKFFHFGADESGYTNDTMTTFLAGCADIIKKAGMTPRAFNDASTTAGSAKIPEGTQITYWHQENGYTDASTLANSGYDMINTHGRWYYVIKTAQNSEKGTKYWQGTVNTTETSVELPTLKAEKMDKKWVGINEFFDANPGSGSTISSNKGVMFCIWCDASSNDYLMDSDVISINENYGALYQLEKLAEHYWADDLKGDNTDPNPTDKTVTVNLEVGSTKTFEDITADAGTYTKDGDIATAEVTHVEGVTETTVSTTKATELEDGASYIMRVYATNYALTTNTGLTDWDTKTLAFETFTAAEDDNVWTLEASGNDGYKLKSEAGYLVLGTGNNTAYTDTTGEVFTLTSTSTGWTVRNPSGEYINALGGIGNLTAGGWTGDGTRFDFYKVTKATEESNTLTITGTGEDTTTVTVGDTTYTINVTAPSKTETQVLNYGGSFTLPEGYSEEKVDGTAVTIENGKVIAGQSDGTATVTCVTTNAGGKVTARYTYNITVSAVNFDKVTPLSVQLWITNTYAGLNGTPTSLQTVSVPAKEAYSEDGVLLSNYAKSPAYKTDNSDPVLTYWKGVVLHDGLYPVKGETDLSNSGDDFTKIRYWNNAWQYNYDGDWKTIVTNDTVVAYYLQINHVSPEITTSTKDYGNPPTSNPGSAQQTFNLTAFAVVYPDGTYSRTELEMYKTGMIRGYWGGTTCGLGLVRAENNSNYKVSKITLTWGDNINGIYSGQWYTGNYSEADYGSKWGVKWNTVTNEAGKEVYDETTYWDADTDGGDPIVNFDKLDGVNFDTTKKHNAALILIYLEAEKKESNLNVVYWDDSNNAQINMKDIQIVVNENVTFINGIEQTSAVNAGTFKLDDDAKIKNSNNVYQTFNKDVTAVPNIYDKYKSGVFKYDYASISDDGKTLTLHYVIDESKVQGIYVLDFGLPVNIPMSDFIADDALETLTEVTWTKKPKAGELRYDKDKKVLIYTPTSTLSEILTLEFTLEFTTGKPGKLTIGVMPASNVLYEENFLTTKENSGWSSSSVEHTTAQESQKTGVTKKVFGYDDTYAESATENGVWTATGLTTTAATGDLTADFYGNSFDLIGNCGPTTGQVMMIIAKQGTTKGVAGVIIDTRYKDTIWQVPLAHIMLREEGKYTAIIRAAGLKAETVAPQAAVYAMNTDNVFADMMDEYGLTSADIEYIGGDQIAASSVAVQSARTAATYATIDRKEGTHVEIAGFRVYRDTTGTVAANYPNEEQNLTYKNILKVVNDTFVACTETDDKFTATVKTYENAGGPQNEIYLAAGQAIVFGVDSEADIQVSLRAVSGEAEWNNTTISSITEMYYKVTPKNADGTFTVTIENTGDKLLAIGNVKVPTGTTTTATSELSDDVILASVRAVSAPEPVEPETFTPDTFKVHVTSLPMFRSKIVTLGITVSKDVDHITVNGRTYYPSKLFSRWLKTVTIPVTETIGRNETKTYTIIAYNADGTASEPIVVKG